MNPELKQKWVEALRSGEYEQGMGRLRTEDDKYCCLGVLCEIQGREWERNEGEWCVVSGSQFDYLGLDDGLIKAVVGGKDAVLNLTDLNDSGNATFTEIADWIEGNL